MSGHVETTMTGGWWKLPSASVVMLGATWVSDLAMACHKVRKYLLDRTERLLALAEKLRA
jgi:hypothetical protein